MFVGCSGVSKSVIVKHVQNIEIIRAFCLSGGDLLSFSPPGENFAGTEKIAGLWFPKRNQYPR